MVHPLFLLTFRSLRFDEKPTLLIHLRDIIGVLPCEDHGFVRFC